MSFHMLCVIYNYNCMQKDKLSQGVRGVWGERWKARQKSFSMLFMLNSKSTVFVAYSKLVLIQREKHF